MILGDKTAYDRSETRTSFNDFYAENKALIDEIKRKDRDFYRLEKTYFHDANDAFLLDYSGISHFSSTLKYKIMQFLPAAGYRFYPTRYSAGETKPYTAIRTASRLVSWYRKGPDFMKIFYLSRIISVCRT